MVGVHGAGLNHVMFMAEEGVLLEIHPHYRLDRHFRNACRMSGKVYAPLRTTQRVSCHGSSDDVPVDAEEFERALDGAVRVARSFDDGLSECGLFCDGGTLALDKGNDNDYDKKGVSRAPRPSTTFPCQ
jgi:hypothetical protein